MGLIRRMEMGVLSKERGSSKLILKLKTVKAEGV